MTNINEDEAYAVLESCSWQLQQAVDIVFSGNIPSINVVGIGLAERRKRIKRLCEVTGISEHRCKEALKKYDCNFFYTD